MTLASACRPQVLLSHEGWVRLRQDMAAASFPVVEQLGRYKAEPWPAGRRPVWLGSWLLLRDGYRGQEGPMPSEQG